MKESAVMHKGKRVILLDLGGVLVEVVSVQRLTELFGGLKTREEIARAWSASKSLRLFESGQCSQAAFAAAIVKELRLPIKPEAFIADFELFLKGFYPGARQLLEKLRSSGCILACLTDTNALQWCSLCKRSAIDQYFSRCFLSYELGATKPAASVYQKVINQLNCNPKDIFYFDDNAANVHAGMQMGMTAFQVTGVEELQQELERQHLL